MTDEFKPRGTAGRDGFDPAISPGDPGTEQTGLYVVTLGPGESRKLDAGDCEWIVLPLSGSAEVTCDGGAVTLDGRRDVFAGPSDLAYVPVGSSFTVASAAGATVALPHARAAASYPFRRVAADEVPVELRGAGQASRQVHNFGTPDVLAADSIIACEVITPAGNWSSYPPHKHDEHRPGEESVLEEIYYFEVRAEGRSGANDPRHAGQSGANDPSGFMRTVEVLAEVRSGDVVLVPRGWHGPAMAPPGYDLYYLNVMAGPGDERVWLICDDPAHAWVRGNWAAEKIDPRLPFGGER